MCLSPAVRKILSGENARRLNSHTLAPSADAKAERERSEREVRGGGWERWEREAATGGDRREPVKRDCGAGAVRSESSPSVGWRRMTQEMGAVEGANHQ